MILINEIYFERLNRVFTNGIVRNFFTRTCTILTIGLQAFESTERGLQVTNRLVEPVANHD